MIRPFGYWHCIHSWGTGVRLKIGSREWMVGLWNNGHGSRHFQEERWQVALSLKVTRFTRSREE